MEDKLVVSVGKLAEKMKLDYLTPEIDIDSKMISYFDVNRPALQMIGFYDHFDASRVQIVGKVEQEYIGTLDPELVVHRFEVLAQTGIPCIIFSRGYDPSEKILQACAKQGVPCFRSVKYTSDLSSEIVRWLKVELAPRMSVHGVLVDVDGVGVLIMGDSGIGKSEAALELVRRGHRLVADDVVELRKVSDETIIGMAPSMIKDFIELRGIGIINIRTLFGFEAVRDTQQIDMVIKLEELDKNKEYDRLGLNDQYISLLGKDIVCHEIPLRPGRNLAVIVECAAINNRAKKMGDNAPMNLFRMVNENAAKRRRERETEN